MAGKPGTGDKAGASEGAMLAALLLSAVAIYLIWTYARTPIIYASFAMDWVQVKVIQLLFGLGQRGSDYLEFIRATFDGRIDPQSVTFHELVITSKEIGWQLRFILSGLLAAMAVLVVFKMKGGGFRRAFSLSGKGGPSFIDYQSLHWKVTTTSARFDPQADDKLQEPARTPMEWMRDNKIALSKADGFDEDAAKKAFSEQLGPLWEGVASAPIYVQAICVMCALSGRRSKATLPLKENLARIWTAERAKAEKQTAALIEPHLKDGKIQKAIERHTSQHAYTNSAMFSLLDWARENGGVIATAEFRWLKQLDRSLWYTLNNVGRRAFHTEGGGAVAHFFSERVAQHPLVEPHVDEAINGILDYLEHHAFIDMDQAGHITVHVNLEDFFRVEDD